MRGVMYFCTGSIRSEFKTVSFGRVAERTAKGADSHPLRRSAAAAVSSTDGSTAAIPSLRPPSGTKITDAQRVAAVAGVRP